MTPQGKNLNLLMGLPRFARNDNLPLKLPVAFVRDDINHFNLE